MPISDPALIPVDIQNDFAKEGFEFDIPGRDFSNVPPMLEAMEEFQDRYRASGQTPIHVRTLHDEATTSTAWEQKYDVEPTPCIVGTEGAEFAPEITVEDDDVIVTKHRYSGFHDTALEKYLRSNDISRVLVGGINTNVCVASTVHYAFNHDYEVKVLSDLCGTTQPEFQEPTSGTWRPTTSPKSSRAPRSTSRPSRRPK